MGKIQIELDDYVKAPNGSLLIKKNGKWVTTTFEELSKNQSEKLKQIEDIDSKVENLSRNVKHFKVYAKSHFMVVFNAFKIAILGGSIDVADKELLDLDKAVVGGKIPVEEAIKMHPFLEQLFNELYVNAEEVYKEV